MTLIVRAGGIGIVVAVSGIFVFLLSQVTPLFRGPRVEQTHTIPNAEPDRQGAILGIDEWGQVPFLYEGGQDVQFKNAGSSPETISIPAGLPEGSRVSASEYHAASQTVALGTTDGRIGTFEVRYRPEFQGGRQAIVPTIVPGNYYDAGPLPAPVETVAIGANREITVLAAVQSTGERKQLHVVVVRRKKSLMGMGRPEKAAAYDLTSLLSGEPAIVRVPATGDAVVVATTQGAVDYLILGDSGPEKRQTFRPMPPGGTIGSMHFAPGDVSLVFTGSRGAMSIWSLLIPDGSEYRVFAPTKALPALPGPASFFAPGQRNKLFLTGSGSTVSLRHSTTERVRWEKDVGFPVAGAAVAAKGSSFVLLDDSGNLHRFEIDDPHPESGWRAYFGRMWYEGNSKPEFAWQSSAGTDDFEPKLSLPPLIYGTLKGTFWAMVFAVPIALLSAIYTGQFMRPETRRLVKPVMEIMASLPSVVLGFLAALWLAPILEPAVPSLILVITGIPLLCAAAGVTWSRLPARHRSLIPPGNEWLALVPLLLLGFWALWEAGPVVERLLFIVKNSDGSPLLDPRTGEVVADFRRWWPQATGTPFNQRNSLVVGLMMGFAVIPVIFTIAEDAISGVPGSLTAASAALGASRWQTLRTVVLPVASSGIFSAIMIGLGRATGETMIVVMATGNTPVMEWNPFSGMRTLAANIATELPEAPVHSTLYRTLFLSALVLFAMTFVINTIAEVLRHRLREKYRLV